MRKIFLIFIFVGFYTNSLSAQIPEPNRAIDCEGTIEAWKVDRNMQDYMRTHTCTCPDPRGHPVCTPRGGGSVPRLPSGRVPRLPSGRLSPSQQMTLQIIQSLLQPIFNAISQDIYRLLAPPTQNELLRQQQEAKKKQEEMKRKALEAWQKAQKEMEVEKLREEAKRKEAGQQIHAQSRIGEDIKLEPSLFGTYQAKLEASTILSAYPAPKNEVDRARCAAYFSQLAKNTKDPEGAKFLSLQAEKVMQGMPTDYPCQLEKASEIPISQESYVKNEEIKAFIEALFAKINELEDIQTKINELRRQKLDAETKLKEADAKISELQAKLTTVNKPEEKAQLDDLLSQALAAKKEAENQLNIAKENEQKLLEIAKQKADEIKAINDQISALEKSK